MIRDATPARRLRMFAAAGNGSHVRFDEVRIERSRRFVLEFKETPIFEADGELHRATSTSVTVECQPGALNVVAGRNFA
jgi:diacylglycerol kinase family enzyme